jgi:hypothetical protein
MPPRFLSLAAAVRTHLYRPIYFEAEEKLLYARYYGVNIDRGEAGHRVKASKCSFSFGVAF